MATQGRAEESRAMDRGSVVRRLYDSFAAWDMEAVAGSLSDDVVFQMPGTGANAGDHRGRVAGEPRLSRLDLPSPSAQAREWRLTAASVRTGQARPSVPPPCRPSRG